MAYSLFGLFQKKRDPRERRRLYRIPEKSANGFRALGFRGGYSVGDTARVRLIIVHKGRPLGFDAKTKILRADPQNKEIAGQFSSMSDAARKDIARVYRERLALYQASGDFATENALS